MHLKVYTNISYATGTIMFKCLASLIFATVSMGLIGRIFFIAIALKQHGG